MSILSLEGVRKQFRSDPVFEALTLGIDWGEKIGVIGANGSGKTTLLRIIAGREGIDAGRVVISSGAQVAYLEQDPPFNPEDSVLDAIFAASSEAMRLVAAYEQACEDVEGGDAAAAARLSDLAARLEASGAWELETNARTVLTQLGIDHVGARMGTLSGGQRKRVALAHALIGRPDLLILDEPTNHLDTEAITWLEGYLAHYSGALMLVTHDRYFLDRVTNHTFEIERGQVHRYVGNYAAYLEKKQQQEDQRAAAGEKRANLMRRELEWLRRGARARATKQKARVERALELVGTPKDGPAATLDIALVGRRLGNKAIEMHNVSKAFDGRPIVADFTHTFQRGDRVGIIGPNGCGKTTLLEILTEHLPPDRGHLEIGTTVAVGYYDQESIALNDSMRVLEYIKDTADAIPTSDGAVITASQMLERFLFSGPLQHTHISRLSGGERRRLYLLKVLMGNPNVLLLDEPTNDLDIPTLVRLEDYLDSFGGVLLVVSHDRYFLDRTVDTILSFESDGHLTEYPGNYTAWLQWKKSRPQTETRKAPAVVPVAPPPVATKVRRLSYRERQELQTLVGQIETCEARKKEIENQLTLNSSDFGLINALYKEREALNATLDRAIERWSALSEIPE